MSSKSVPSPVAEGLPEPELIRLRLRDILPNDANARDHDAEQLRLLEKSLGRYGLVALPVVQAGTHKLIAGHGRLLALKKKLPPDAEIPVLSVALSDQDAIAYGVADNRLTDLSTWNIPALKAAIAEIDDGTFDLEALGFTDAALADLFPQDEPQETGLVDGADPDDAPPLPEVPFSKQGDLWLVGRHRLLCGDSTLPVDVARLMDGAVADLILTDPPYGMSYESHVHGAIQNDDLDRKALEEFLIKCFACMVAASRANAPWYVWHSYHRQREFQNALEAVGLRCKSQIIWVKPSAGLGMDEFRRKHENAFVAGRVEKDIGLIVQEHGAGWFGHRLKQKPPVWLGERTQTTVWECGRDAGKDLHHPTQKPVDLLLKAMRLSTRPKHLVLDLFAGSGSTLMACEVSGRSCCTMELDEKFVDVVVRRWQNATGRKATLLRDRREIPGALPEVHG